MPGVDAQSLSLGGGNAPSESGGRDDNDLEMDSGSAENGDMDTREGVSPDKGRFFTLYTLGESFGMARKLRLNMRGWNPAGLFRGGMSILGINTIPRAT
jgi:hypothetical protein